MRVARKDLADHLADPGLAVFRGDAGRAAHRDALPHQPVLRRIHQVHVHRALGIAAHMGAVVPVRHGHIAARAVVVVIGVIDGGDGADIGTPLHVGVHVDPQVRAVCIEDVAARLHFPFHRALDGLAGGGLVTVGLHRQRLVEGPGAIRGEIGARIGLGADARTGGAAGEHQHHRAQGCNPGGAGSCVVTVSLHGGSPVKGRRGCASGVPGTSTGYPYTPGGVESTRRPHETFIHAGRAVPRSPGTAPPSPPVRLPAPRCPPSAGPQHSRARPG